MEVQIQDENVGNINSDKSPLTLNKNNKSKHPVLNVTLLVSMLLIILLGFILYIRATYNISNEIAIRKQNNNLANHAPYNGFSDTPECANFNNYAVNNIQLPQNFILQMRNYVQCGNYYNDGANPTQTMLLGLKGKKSYNSLSEEENDLNTWFTSQGWMAAPKNDPNINQSVGNINNIITKGLIDIQIEPISLNPAYVTIDVLNNVDYSKYPAIHKSSPSQILPPLVQQINEAPYIIYAPTITPYPSTPKASNVNVATQSFLRIYYTDNYLQEYFSSSQINKAKENCESGAIQTCQLIATTSKGYQIFGSTFDETSFNKTGFDNGYLFVDIGDTEIELYVGGINTGNYAKGLTLDQWKSLIDSLEKVQ